MAGPGQANRLSQKVLGSPERYPAELASWISKYFSGNKLLKIARVQLSTDLINRIADKLASATQTFAGAVFSGANPALPTSQTGSGLAANGMLRSVVSSTASFAWKIAVANGADTRDRMIVLGDGTVQWSSGAAVADVQQSRLAAGRLQIQAIGGIATGLTIGDGVNVGRVDDAGGGILITNSSGNKLAFYGGTPTVRPSAVGSATGYTAGTTVGTFHTDDKYTGNVGATAYTINGIVAALKNLGLIAP